MPPEFNTKHGALRSQTRSDQQYLETLRRYGTEIGVNTEAVDFALALARGNGDLLVVLLEPLDYYVATALSDGVAKSHTLKEIDRILQKVSNNSRNIANTNVFDAKVFLTARKRIAMEQRKFDILVEQERSFNVFEQMVHQLNPKVIISCQCGTSDGKNPLVRNICSRFPPPPSRICIQIHGKQVPVLRGYHPAVYKEKNAAQWAGPTRQKQEEFVKITKELLEVIFFKGFRATLNTTVAVPREGLLRDRLYLLLSAKRNPRDYQANKPPLESAQASPRQQGLHPTHKRTIG